MKGGKTESDELNRYLLDLASMRPAREGRENVPDVESRAGPNRASMRPAREGRENAAGQSEGRRGWRGFNEARP